MGDKNYGMYMNHPAKKMMNGLKKIRVRYKPTKRAGHIEKGVVKNQLEIVEVGKDSLFPHKFSLNFALIFKCPSMTQQKLLKSIPNQNRGPL